MSLCWNTNGDMILGNSVLKTFIRQQIYDKSFEYYIRCISDFTQTHLYIALKSTVFILCNNLITILLHSVECYYAIKLNFLLFSFYVNAKMFLFNLSLQYYYYFNYATVLISFTANNFSCTKVCSVY